MASINPGFEYDIFISYRHNDNLDGWVTEFVQNLQKELKATVKEPVSIYFDKNPHDGLLETHRVDKSLEGKLKCLIFIPIVSQTYCDPKSFAWQHEFCAFNVQAREDFLGSYINLKSGNVSSRILPVKIHDLDPEDSAAIEGELNGPLRAIEFIYKEPGVNRPLKPTDARVENLNKTDYRNQTNKVANAVKEMLMSLTQKKASELPNGKTNSIGKPKSKRTAWVVGAVCMLIAAILGYYFKPANIDSDKYSASLDRADKYLDEVGRFDDKRYLFNALDAVQQVLKQEPQHERALYLMLVIAAESDTAEVFINKLISINPNGVYTLLGKAGQALSKNKTREAQLHLEKLLETDPRNKEALRILAVVYLHQKDYLNAWQAAKRYKEATGETFHEILSDVYLELGDFDKAEEHWRLKRKEKEFSCPDLEALQRIYLCVGKFEKLEQLTDSICAFTKCDQCSYWRLRAKTHVEKYNEAAPLVADALKKNPKIMWRLPAFVLQKSGKPDSARLILEAEIAMDKEKLADTAYHQSIPLYSLAAIYAMQGNKTESLKLLQTYAQKGFELGSEWYIAHDPLFNELQKDHEFFADFIQIIQKAQAPKNSLREKLRQLEENAE